MNKAIERIVKQHDVQNENDKEKKNTKKVIMSQKIKRPNN